MLRKGEGRGDGDVWSGDDDDVVDEEVLGERSEGDGAYRITVLTS
jgi:hypothetical protein